MILSPWKDSSDQMIVLRGTVTSIHINKTAEFSPCQFNLLEQRERPTDSGFKKNLFFLTIHSHGILFKIPVHTAKCQSYVILSGVISSCF